MKHSLRYITVSECDCFPVVTHNLVSLPLCSLYTLKIDGARYYSYMKYLAPLVTMAALCSNVAILLLLLLTAILKKIF